MTLIIRYLTILLLPAVMLATSCLKSEPGAEIDPLLNDAENLIESNPDTALQILQRLEGMSLSGERRARHALLLSQAYDKNYIDLTNDSLISIAVDFYEQTDNTRYKMLAYLYHGCVHLNGGKYGPALHALLDAYDLATAMADTLNMSRIESKLGRIYVMAYDYNEALRWDSLALEHAKQLNNQVWIQNTYENIAGEYMSMGQYREALLYADSAIVISQIPSPDVLDIQFRSYFGLNMDDKADSVLAIIKETGLPLTKEINDVVEFYRERTPRQTLEYKNQTIRELNEYIKEIFNGTLSSALTQRLADKNRLQNEENRRNRMQIVVLTIVGLFSVTTLLLLLIVVRQRSKTRQAQIESRLYALRADFIRVQGELQQKESKISGLKRGVVQLTQQATEAQRSYEALRHEASVALLKRFSWVDELGNIFLDAKLSAGNTEHKLYQTIDTKLSGVTSKSCIAEIERTCYKETPELLAEIDRLNLNRSEREILLLTIAGISNRVICMLAEKTTASIYSTRSRLKNKLQSADTPFAHYLLTIF